MASAFFPGQTSSSYWGTPTSSTPTSPASWPLPGQSAPPYGGAGPMSSPMTMMPNQYYVPQERISPSNQAMFTGRTLSGPVRSAACRSDSGEVGHFPSARAHGKGMKGEGPDRTTQVVAASGLGGAVLVGAGGAGAGLLAGGAAGAAIGLVPALFTFGLSIPIGAGLLAGGA